MPAHRTPAQEFRDALRPLVRRLTRERTMSLAKAGILMQLTERERATAAELAAAEQITPQGITSAIQDLEKEGLVERMPDDVDRRRIWVHLTDAGKRRFEAERAAGDRWLATALEARLTSDERQALIAAIPAMRKLIQESPE